MDPFVVIGFGFLIVIGLALATIFWESHKSDRMIARWAEDHGYTVLERQQPLVNLGPFRWEKPRGRTFWYVTVRDGGGRARRGWISCGVWPLGRHPNQVEIRWDAGEPPQVSGPQEEGVWPPPPVPRE